MFRTHCRHGVHGQSVALARQFKRFADILGQTPVQASGREHLRELLNRASGGVVFICVDLHNALIKRRPEREVETLWVVMTGSAEDGPEWQRS